MDGVRAATLMRSRPSPAIGAGLVSWTTAGLTLLAIIPFTNTPATIDFHLFYESAIELRDGMLGARGIDDLNPPTFALFFAPFTLLPLHTAYLCWFVTSAACVAASLIASAQRSRWSLETWLWVVGGLGALLPARIGWTEGQVTWLLLLFVTFAWLTADVPLKSGLWLGVAVAIKPPLALMALLLPWRIMLVAAAVSMTITGLVIGALGWLPWLRWMERLGAVDWLAKPINGSLWGVATRIQTGWIWAPIRLRDVDAWLFAAVLAIGAALAWRAIRRAGDRRWVLAGLWSILLSPAGWIYYLPILIGPMIASWRATTSLRLAVILMLIPVPVVAAPAGTPIGAVLGGSVYFGAILLLWWNWDRRE